MIRKATPGDIEAVEQIYTELLTFEKNGVSYSNWQLGIYPTEETARKAMEEETLFVLEEEGEICASIILNQEQADFYNDIPWRYEAAPNEVFVIHTLCVPPSRSGKGYATALIDFTKEYAAGEGAKVIRLDTYAGNEPAKTLYQKKGFRIAGCCESVLEGLIPEELVLLEYLL